MNWSPSQFPDFIVHWIQVGTIRWPPCVAWARTTTVSRVRCRVVSFYNVLDLTWFIQHPRCRATRWRQVCLSWADASASSQVNPILWMSLFTISLQFILGLPGLLLNPGTSHCSACFGMRTSSILVTRPISIAIFILGSPSLEVFVLFFSVPPHLWLYPSRWYQCTVRTNRTIRGGRCTQCHVCWNSLW